MLAAAVVVLSLAADAAAQAVTHRGFVDARAVYFPRDAANDTRHIVGDLLIREEAFVEATDWLQLAAGVDLRANTHDQVGHSWTPDLSDRSLTRPPLSVRRLSATVHRGPITIDAGRQFIRWGRTDILAPTDRFTPRDYLNVIDDDFLAVTGVRTRLSNGFDSIDVAWVPVFTPSRIPLLDQRWTAGAGLSRLALVDVDRHIPDRWQAGVRWERVGAGYEFAVAYYDGFSHLPVIEPAYPLPIGEPFEVIITTEPLTPSPLPAAPFPVVRRFPGQRMVGGDAALPTRWVTLKGEAGYFQARDETLDDYVLYVVQVERQTGEWLLIAGYAGEYVTRQRTGAVFAPDRGIARSFLGSASYTIDSTRSVAFEGAVRDGGDGMYAKAEYSQAYGAHLRATISGAVIAGSADDFLGQYERNSHLVAGLRYSF